MKNVYMIKGKPHLVLCWIAMLVYQIETHWPQFQGGSVHGQHFILMRIYSMRLLKITGKL